MRRILYVWTPCLLVTAERLLDPTLAERPLLVVTGRGSQGRVVEASAEVDEVCRGMNWRHAQRRCPEAVVTLYQADRYAPVVERLAQVLNRFTPWVEFFSGERKPGGRSLGVLGELFADLGQGDAGSGVEMGCRIRDQLQVEMGLGSRMGLGTGKVTARVAGRRACEGEVQLVLAGRERGFLADEPLGALWDMSAEAVRRLELLGIRTLGQMAALPAEVLTATLGPVGSWYRRLAQGMERRSVAVWQPRPAEVATCFVDEGVGDAQHLALRLERLAGELAAALAEHGRFGKEVALTLHVAGGTRGGALLFAARRLKEPVRAVRPLSEAACALWMQLLPRLDKALGERADESVEAVDLPGAATVFRRPSLELMELSVTYLTGSDALQLSLFGDEDRSPALRSVVARVQERYGERVLMSGSCVAASRFITAVE